MSEQLSTVDQVVKSAREVLHDEDLSAGDSFFERGGDSVTAIDWRNKLETELGIDVSLDLIWEFPTVGALGKHLEALNSSFPVSD